MPTVSSQIVSNSQQVDGSLLIHEQHTIDGVIYDHIYHAAADLDIEAACQARGVAIAAELASKAAALAEATNYELPLTAVEIMRRITPVEWAAFQSSTDAGVAYFRAVFAKTDQVYRTDPLTVAGFSALVDAGILTTERVSEVLA